MNRLFYVPGPSVSMREEKVSSCESVHRTTRNTSFEDKEKVQKPDIYQVIFFQSVNTECKPKNVILFGEVGVGKSSVINLLAGAEIVQTSVCRGGCTLNATGYSFSIPGSTALRIFDTVGLEEPEIGVNKFFDAILKVHSLVRSLQSAGGVDLLLFCIPGGRVTFAMKRSYSLFREVLCGGQVPLAVIVTHLEDEDVMEDWWFRNHAVLQRYGIHSVAHACITALRDGYHAYAQKRAESREALQKILLEVLTKPSSTPEERGLLSTTIHRVRSSLKKNRTPLEKLERKLEKECMLPSRDAQKLARMLAT